MKDITLNKKPIIAQNFYESEEYNRENHPWNIGWAGYISKETKKESNIIEHNHKEWIEMTTKSKKD